MTWSQFIKPGDIVFDIGAYDGDYTAEYLHYDPSLIVAVEPQSEKISYLEKKFADRGVKVVVMHCALGERAGEATLHMCDNAATISTLSQEWMDKSRFACYIYNREERVSVITLDMLIAMFGKPSLIKIDAEGYDHIILRGLNIAVDAVRFEYVCEFSRYTVEGVKKLSSLARYQFAYMPGEDIAKNMLWMQEKDFINHIRRISYGSGEWGNIYARKTG